MCETANQTKNFAELAGRTQPVVGDVVMSILNMGVPNMGDLEVGFVAPPIYFPELTSFLF